jgi:hypothetical protein
VKTVNLEKLLPEDIPPGERILWFGRPDWFVLYRSAYRADFVAGYFLLLAAWSAAEAATLGAGASLMAAGRALGIGLAALALLALLAWSAARTALFVITSRRVVMKIGVALQVFYNLPFSRIRNAALRVEKDGSGELALDLVQGKRIAYLNLWPFARPFHFATPEPALRGLFNAQLVGDILGRALAAAAQERGEAFSVDPDKAANSNTASVAAGDPVAA